MRWEFKNSKWTIHQCLGVRKLIFNQILSTNRNEYRPADVKQRRKGK